MKLDINQRRIYMIRDAGVMLDYDIASLYETTVQNLHDTVKKYADRFPGDSMFQLTREEWDDVNALLKEHDPESLQNEKLIAHKSLDAQYIPQAYTESGLAMLSSVLDTAKAIRMNREIISAL